MRRELLVGQAHDDMAIGRRRLGLSLGRALICLSLGLVGCQTAPTGVQLKEPELASFGDRLVFAGHITRSSANLFRDKMRGGQYKTLVIASPGGDVDAAIDIAETVLDSKMDVEVQMLCASSCANYIFPAGARKLISPGAIVGWHGNVTHLAYLDRMDPGRSSEQVREHIRHLAAREAAFFRRIGVDGYVCWFGKLAPYNVRGTYALSVNDMQAFGIANVIASKDYPLADLASLQSAGPERVELISLDGASWEAHRPSEAK